MNITLKTKRGNSRKKVSLNIFASQIFGEYIDWQRYAKRFGIVSMSKTLFVLDSWDNKQITELSTTIGQTVTKEFILSKWQK